MSDFRRAYKGSSSRSLRIHSLTRTGVFAQSVRVALTPRAVGTDLRCKEDDKLSQVCRRFRTQRHFVASLR